MSKKDTIDGKKYYLDQASEDRQGMYLAVGFLLLVGLLSIIWQLTSVPRPGAFHERGEYSAKVMVDVNLFDGTDRSYRLPADITRSDGVYEVEKVYWPNGGYTDFSWSGCDTSTSEIKFEVECTALDSDENEVDYIIDITDEIVE